jgi:hypothetical protein
MSLVLKEALVVLIFLSFFWFSPLSGRPINTDICQPWLSYSIDPAMLILLFNSFRIYVAFLSSADGKNNEQTNKRTGLHGPEDASVLLRS